MEVELLLAPRCPNAAAARTMLTVCLRRLNLDLPVRERVGDYPSPTILVNGVDVMTAQPGRPSGQACRLDLPTPERVLAALHHPEALTDARVRGDRAIQPTIVARWSSQPSESPCKRPSACSGPPISNRRHPGPREGAQSGTGNVAITVRRERGTRRVVVVISGALDARAVPCLGRALVAALRTRAPILIDLTGATSIDRDVLTMLVVAYRQAERVDRPFLLRTEPTQIRDILVVLGIPPENDDY